jgi:RNA 2',3'-cyclic 3'-phosphodiesterase
MPRLFTAIPVSHPLQSLQKGLHDANWIEPEDFHITLKFIGDVSTTLANEIDEELRVAPFSPMTLEFDG